MQFTKMHGLGNNYIYFDLLKNSLEGIDLNALAKSVSDINYGVGSDGMILICPAEHKEADFRMRIFNADGSEGKNCGNGLRCTAKYIYDHGYASTSTFKIETMGGMIVEAEVFPNEGIVKIDMGEPELLKESIPMQGNPQSKSINESFEIGEKSLDLTSVSMGNPHTILFVDDVKAYPLEDFGPIVENAALFPERVNFGIVQVVNEQEVNYRVWERGSGITMACGTGACAAVVAATLNNKVSRNKPITVHLPGGDLIILWDMDNHVWKSGPAEYIFHGEWDTEPFRK